MAYDPEKHHRRSIRLKGYDYSQPGAYFVTIVTKHRRRLFGRIINGLMKLSPLGYQAHCCWLEIPDHFPNVELGEFVIMPDHVHGIIIIVEPSGGGKCLRGHDSSAVQSGSNQERKLPSTRKPGTCHTAFRSPSQTIGSIVRGFKVGVTKWARTHTSIQNVWHRNYYESIIRSERHMQCVTRYIRNNPAAWEARKSLHNDPLPQEDEAHDADDG